MPHREGIREYLKDVQVHGLVIDWGSGSKPIENYLKPNDAKFITVDKAENVGADKKFDFEDNVVHLYMRSDFAFCLEVLEHLWNPRMALYNIFNHLDKNGILYLSQPFLYGVHKEDDRIRYTHYGLRQLLEEAGFKVEDIHPTVGDLDNAEGYIVKAVK